jgi:hypothetical protein
MQSDTCPPGDSSSGRDTTAISLTFVLYLLALHPDVEARVVDEIRREVGSGPLTSTNLAALEYTKRVIMETLRMYPPGAPGALLAGPCPFMLCDYMQANVTLCPNCTPFPQCLSLDLHATAPRTCLATTTLPGAHSSPTPPTASIAARYAACPSAALGIVPHG